MDEGTRRRDTSVDESEQFSPETEAGIGTTRDFEVAGILEWKQLEVKRIRRDSFKSKEGRNKVGKRDFKGAQV